jgi:replicative DNA helicase
MTDAADDTLRSLPLEQAVNAAILRDNAVLDRLGPLKPEHFLDPEMREVFSSARALHDEGRPVNLVTLRALVGSDPLGGATIADRLRAVTFDAGEEPAPRDMAASLIDLAQRRELRALCESVGGSAVDLTKRPAALAEMLVRESERMLVQSTPAGKTYWVAPDAMDEALNRLARDTSADRIPTGIKPLDEITGGLHRKHTTYLAARTSMGKTALAVAVGANAAKSGHGVLYVSIEMALHDLEARLASMATYDRRRSDRNIPFAWAVNNNLDTAENERFVRAGMVMGKLPITVEEGTNISTAKIGSLIRKAAREFKEQSLSLGLVIVDLITKVAPRDPRASVFDQLTQISRDLTALAKSEDVAMLALHQLNRGVEDRPNNRPRKSDLRGCGSLEEDADNIWMLYREHYYLQRKESPEDETPAQALARQVRLKQLENRMEIIVEKNRHGPTGTADVFCALECNVIQDNDE